MKTITDTVTVITGAGSGIGRATALSLARRGGHVVVTDIDEDRAGELVVQGILDGQFLILTHPAAQELVTAHGTDRQAFLQAQLHSG